MGAVSQELTSKLSRHEKGRAAGLLSKTVAVAEVVVLDSERKLRVLAWRYIGAKQHSIEVCGTT